GANALVGERGRTDRLPHGVGVVVVPRRLREQKHVLVRLRRPVGHRFRHRVGLRPDDVGAEVPAVGLERQGEPPRHADQIFRLEARKGFAAAPTDLAMSSCGVYPAPAISLVRIELPHAAFATAALRRIAVAHVEPQRAVRTQHAAHVAQHADHRGEVVLGRGLQADLLVHTARAAPAAPLAVRHASSDAFLAVVGPHVRAAIESKRALVADKLAVEVTTRRIAALPARGPVAPQPPVRRRRDDALDALRRERRQHGAAIAFKECEAHAASGPRARATSTISSAKRRTSTTSHFPPTPSGLTYIEVLERAGLARSRARRRATTCAAKRALAWPLIGEELALLDQALRGIVPRDGVGEPRASGMLLRDTRDYYIRIGRLVGGARHSDGKRHQPPDLEPMARLHLPPLPSRRAGALRRALGFGSG